MKNLNITLFALLMMLSVGRMQAQTANLTVYTESKENFTLIVNGQKINAVPSQHVRVTGLQPSKYKVEAVFTGTAYPAQALIIPVQADREISYALMRSTLAGPLTFQFLSESLIGYYPVAPQDVTTVIYTGPLKDPGTPVVAQPTPAPTPTPAPATVIVVPVAAEVSDRPDPLPGYEGPKGCLKPMDEDAFREAKKSITSKQFSDTKMQVAQQITRDHCLLTSQVKDVMREFSFESQKLEFAKFAYPYTYDQGNYYKINDAFGFESSIRDLEKHLSEIKEKKDPKPAK